MGKKKQKTWVVFAQSLAIAMGVYLMGMLLIAFLAVKGIAPENALLQLLAIAGVLASFSGARFAVKRAGIAPLYALLAVTAMFWAILLLVGIFIYDGIDLRNGGGLILLAILLGSAMAGLAGKKRKKRKIHTK